MKLKILSLAFALFSACNLMPAATVLAGGSITLSNTPAALTTGSFKVNEVRIRVIPGFACKAYVGTSGFSRASLNGVFAVLYPNFAGGWSEEWALKDPRNGDGIDLASIYVAGDCPGEAINYFYFQTGSTLATLQLFRSGPLSPATFGSGTGGSAIWGGSTQTAMIGQIRVIPGFVGKMRILGYGAVHTILYPNTGNPAESSARSERWEFVDKTNTWRPDLTKMEADVAGEQVLVSLWRSPTAP